MNISEEIEKLSKQKADGLLSEHEFAQAKAKLIADSEGASPPGAISTSGKPPVDVNQWSMFIHLSQLTSMLMPGAGLILPIVLWQVKKDESPIIDQHGKNVTNWVISSAIYFAVSAVLVFALIGILLLPVIALLSLIFSIVGGLKAKDGEVWKYPLTINFLK
jgi:uncharacterized Tic20 family protein